MNITKLLTWMVPTTLAIAIGVTGCKDYGNTQYYSNDKIGLLNEYLQTGYLYDLQEVTNEQMSDSIYKNFVGVLDNPGTYYLNEEELTRLQVMNEGNYLGTGLELAWEPSGKSIIVTGIIEGSMASSSGVKVGDYVTSIDGIKVTGANQQQIMEKIVYTGNEVMEYTIKEKDTNIQKDIELTASEVKVLDIVSELKDGIGYIEVKSIRNGTSDNIGTTIDEFNKNGAKGLILDLRGTHTDNLDEVAKISDLFLETGIAFKSIGKENKVEEFEMTTGAYDKQVVIITNGYTAAGAEALVSALKDICIHVGADTNGLIYASEIIELGDGTGLSVATKIICDKAGNEINEKGIKPDEVIFITEKEKIQIIENGTIGDENDSFIKAAINKFK